MRWLVEQDLGSGLLKEQPEQNAPAPSARRSSASYAPKKTKRQG
jgi:hypothetical protein